jgi:hypothetical protein
MFEFSPHTHKIPHKTIYGISFFTILAYGPPHQHVGARHPMARLPRPHTSPSTTLWPHYPPFVAVKFVVCSERGAIFHPWQSCDLCDNHTSWQITRVYRLGMAVVTTTNIILDNTHAGMSLRTICCVDGDLCAGLNMYTTIERTVRGRVWKTTSILGIWFENN